MKKNYKLFSKIIFIAATCVAFTAGAQLTNTIAYILFMLFFGSFGFGVVTISILYKSNYLKHLHRLVIDDASRGTHVLKAYLLALFYLSTGSIIAIIIWTTSVNTLINKLLTSILMGSAALNIYFIILLIQTLVNGLLVEARNTD